MLILLALPLEAAETPDTLFIVHDKGSPLLLYFYTWRKKKCQNFATQIFILIFETHFQCILVLRINVGIKTADSEGELLR